MGWDESRSEIKDENLPFACLVNSHPAVLRVSPGVNSQ
jgi:hypothetical protein